MIVRNELVEPKPEPPNTRLHPTAARVIMKRPRVSRGTLGGALADLDTRRKELPMAWITWIEIEPDDTANEVVQQLYERTRDPATGHPPDTVRLTSLRPQVAGLLHDLQKAIYHGANGLTLREREIAALLVSTYNGCVH